MNKEKISKAISMTDDDLLEEANVPRLHKPNFAKYMTVAACFIVAFTVTVSYTLTKHFENELYSDSFPNATVTVSSKLPPANEGNSSVSTPPYNNLYDGNFEQYHWENDTLTVIQRESESILLKINNTISDYDISMNIIAPDGTTYVFSTDLTKNTLSVPASVEINYIDTSEFDFYFGSECTLIKITYENLLSNGYTVDDCVTVGNFGKIPINHN